ncbi:hypothetical protein LOCC1_G001376 [Lachnellula occidentalis]|uniref:Uncharacterized protein n=1 Tax=Lachnellula occidentalis TaxID=215460 RepID=A0A8H8S8N6_9HELO|nr:hypothetical protein LOCC1_G001376 [Lachnellula occidentalis]
MGKGKGKAVKRAEKTAVKTAKKDAKRVARESTALTGITKPTPKGPSLKAIKKRALKEKNTNAPGPSSFPIPTGHAKPFTKSPQHAKWPALFKKSLGVTEAHIRKLDRVMQSMKSEMVEMGEQERLEWELGARGNWRRICGMMDRAREILAQEREAAKGILPAKYLRDKKGLGVAGTNFEPLGPKLAERAEALGFNNQEPEQNDTKMDSDGDSEMEDVSSLSSGSDSDSDSDLSLDSSDLDSSSDSEAENEKQEPASNDRKTSASDKEEEAVPVVESNPYFVVDTEPMPIRGLEKPSLSTLKKSKKRSQGEDGEAKKSKKAKKEKVVEENVQAEPEPTAAAQPESEPAAEAPKKSKKRSHSDADTESKKSKKHKSTTIVEVTEQEAPVSNVDFAEVQRKLQAEVDAGVAAKEAEKAAEKAKKKRRRSSGEGGEGGEGGDKSVKKVRKGKST